MGENQYSVVVLQIRAKFWWMMPMGVKYNHTKFEQETPRWRPGTVVARGGPQFQKLQFRAKNSHFWAKTALEPIHNGQTKGKGCFGTKNGSKMGQKRIFATIILDHLGCTNG